MKYGFIALIMALVFASNSLSLGAEQSVLFDGELVIKEDGVYTKVHYYKHPLTGREVILIGTSHLAELDYYNRINDILETCQYVIYEGPLEKRTKSDIKNELAAQQQMWSSQLFNVDINTAFRASVFAPFTLPRKMLTLLGLTETITRFDYSKDGWISGDNNWYDMQDKNSWQNFWSAIDKKAEAIPPEVKNDIVNFVRKMYFKIEADKIAKRDYADFINILWGDYCEVVVEQMQGWFVVARDIEAFKVFDQIVGIDNPLRIGMIFGEYHMINQRMFLENRGYEYQHSRALRAVSLP